MTDKQTIAQLQAQIVDLKRQIAQLTPKPEIPDIDVGETPQSIVKVDDPNKIVLQKNTRYELTNANDFTIKRFFNVNMPAVSIIGMGNKLTGSFGDHGGMFEFYADRFKLDNFTIAVNGSSYCFKPSGASNGIISRIKLLAGAAFAELKKTTKLLLQDLETLAQPIERVLYIQNCTDVTIDGFVDMFGPVKEYGIRANGNTRLAIKCAKLLANKYNHGPLRIETGDGCYVADSEFRAGGFGPLKKGDGGQELGRTLWILKNGKQVETLDPAIIATADKDATMAKRAAMLADMLTGVVVERTKFYGNLELSSNLKSATFDDCDMYGIQIYNAYPDKGKVLAGDVVRTSPVATFNANVRWSNKKPESTGNVVVL